MSYDTASLLEPMGVALHTLQIMDINFLDTACIFGAGTVGLCILLALKRAGVTTIFSVDPLEYRCKFSEKFGSVGILYDESYHKKIKELTNNEGTSLVFDVAGTCDSVNGCLLVSATSGKMGIVGIPEEDFIDYNPHKMRMKEMKLYNIRRSNQTLDDCVNLYSNISLDDLVTHRFNLDDIQNAFDIASSYSDNVIKCVVADDV
jgi:L-iditol 2-dehydrogenase